MQIDSAAAFSSGSTGGDLARLRATLRETLAKSGPHPPGGGHRRVLNLACGRADETGVLAEVLGEHAASLELFCSDLRPREIAEARERWDQAAHPSVDTRFIAEDATRLFARHDLPGEFDVAILRHQNFWHGPGLWTRIFDGALHRLDEDGLLVITSYFDREHALACEALRRLGAHQMADHRHLASRALRDAPGKSVDRRLAVFRRDRGSRAPGS